MSHLCHWPGCKTPVPPRLWGCRPHWSALPQAIKTEIWRTYRPGQEDHKDPSPDYLVAARQAEAFARGHDTRVAHVAQAQLEFPADVEPPKHPTRMPCVIAMPPGSIAKTVHVAPPANAALIYREWLARQPEHIRRAIVGRSGVDPTKRLGVLGPMTLGALIRTMPAVRGAIHVSRQFESDVAELARVHTLPVELLAERTRAITSVSTSPYSRACVELAADQLVREEGRCCHFHSTGGEETAECSKE